ncbi:MAG: hypothetical protein QOD93_5646 [Acetobacteraceae bacterium]|nr:hypothetical protein [Acetobacteraceae bacterium]
MATQVRPPQIDLQMGGDQRHRLPAVDRNEHPIPQILRVRLPLLMTHQCPGLRPELDESHLSLVPAGPEIPVRPMIP